MLQADLSSGAAWMEGEIIPISEAKISVTDWGLTRSDITYDVVHVWDGAFFRLDDYIGRFFQSISGMRLEISQSPDDVKQILHDMVAASKLRSAYVSMVASRGAPSIPGTRDPRTCNNHFYAWVVPFIWVIPQEIAKRGAHLFVADTATRIPASSVDPTIKNYHWGDMTRGLFQALDNGFDSAILVDLDGNITEGPGFNVFAIINGTIVTPDKGALEGITRRTVLEISKELQLPTEVRPISKQEFLDADEILTATTAGGPVSVTRVNNRVYGNDTPGEITKQIIDTYWAWHQKEAHVYKIQYAR
ncbi:MAG: aminotransferase class IV [Pseudomonadota bacterium]